MPCPYCNASHSPAESCSGNAGRLDVLTLGAGEAGAYLAADTEDAESRDVSGIAIPYGVELRRLDWLTGATRWVFEPGSVTFSEGAKLYYGHAHLYGNELPIGRVVDSEQVEAGLQVNRATISRTQHGDDVLTLCRDGVLDRFSVGLDRTNARTRVEDADSDDPLLVFEAIEAWEVSVVPQPAYDEARMDPVLHRTTNPRESRSMPCTRCGHVHAAGVTTCETTNDNLSLQQLGDQLSSVEGSLQTVERQLATLGEGGGADPRDFALTSHSFGEWLQQLAAGEQNAVDFLAFVGQTTDDLYDGGPHWMADTWVGELVARLTERRRVLNLFRTRPLPATGMNVEFGRVLDDSAVQVAEQVNEGDLLAYGKLAFDGGLSTPVRTFGGWGDMSRQVIERSGAAVVEMFYEALYNRYLRVTEAAVRTLAANPTSATPVGPAGSAVTALDDLDDWTDFVIDASFMLDDAGLPLDFILASRERFKTLAKMRVGGPDSPYALNRTTGTIDVTGLNGELFTVPVVPLNVAGDYVRAGSGDAITTFEAGGAPFRLQDDDITNLTSAFSLYGYAAFASTNKAALIRPRVAGDNT